VGESRGGTSTYDVDGIDHWAQLGSSTFVPLQCRAAEDSFHGVLTATTVGHLQLARLRASAHEVARTKKMIARNDPGVIKLGLQVNGTGRLAQDGRQAELKRGDLVLYDTTRPYTLQMSGTGTETVVLMFSAAALGVPAPALGGLTATRLRGDEGIGALVSPFLGRLAGVAPQLDPMVTAEMGRTVLDLVGTLVRHRLDLGAGEPQSAHRARLEIIKAWIGAHLGEPELNPETVAAAHHISVRYLYRLFETEGTSVARWIRTLRLQGCRRDLADPALAQVGVGALAARWGMPDPAGFSRAFRSVYGESPRAFRARHRVPMAETVQPSPTSRAG
jgi:AraC-like DNA-binding protein